MRFNPDQEQDSNVMPAGEYDFEVIYATEKISSGGNDMIVLKLRVGDRHRGHVVTDYILAKNTWKILSAAKACGLVELFHAGEILPQHFVGCTGRAQFMIERSTNPQYPDRNTVLSYVAPNRAAQR